MNRTLINIYGITITWYAIFIVSALIIGYYMFTNSKYIKQLLEKNEEMVYDYIFYLIIFAFLGARLWYVTFNLKSYLSNPLEIIAIWHGGMAIHGGILGGLVYTIIFTKKNNLNLFAMTDCLVTPLLLGQAIGRWGNFINQEAHGPATTYQILHDKIHLPNFIVQGMKIDGIYYQPTFLYESIFNFLGFLLIIFILNKKWDNKTGYLTAFYLMWYGFIRTIIEQFRTDALYLGPVRIAQFTSIIMFISGIIIFKYLNKKLKKQLK